jgi:hypothetical protein
VDYQAGSALAEASSQDRTGKRQIDVILHDKRLSAGHFVDLRDAPDMDRSLLIWSYEGP